VGEIVSIIDGKQQSSSDYGTKPLMRKQ